MGEFFKGWKRKVGCVTLVTACFFMAAWVRGQDAEADNTMSFTNFDKKRYVLFLWPDRFCLTKVVRVYDGNQPGLSTEAVLEVPHWSITIPLTALAAYLLLTKPRKSTQKKIGEPIANEGA